MVDEHGALIDAVLAGGARPGAAEQPLSELTDAQLPTVVAEADLPEVARLMTDYNLVAMPVLDQSGAPVGIIAVDDVLEQLLPADWRRRAGAARG